MNKKCERYNLCGEKKWKTGVSFCFGFCLVTLVIVLFTLLTDRMLLFVLYKRMILNEIATLTQRKKRVLVIVNVRWKSSIFNKELILFITLSYKNTFCVSKKWNQYSKMTYTSRYFSPIVSFGHCLIMHRARLLLLSSIVRYIFAFYFCGLRVRQGEKEGEGRNREGKRERKREKL